MEWKKFFSRRMPLLLVVGLLLAVTTLTLAQELTPPVPEEDISAVTQPQVGVPRRLSEVGVSADMIPAIAASSRGSSMSKNPRDVPDDEVTALLEAML